MKKAAALILAVLVGLGVLATAAARETVRGRNGKIVFVRRGELWVMGERGRNETRLTRTKARETAPTVSPNGKRIAFTRMRGEFKGAIFTMRMNGTGLRRLTGFRHANVGPAYSPDGTKILYTWSSGEDVAQVRIMDRDGENMKKLTGKSDNLAPVWSPSGERIAYYNRLGRRPGLYVMDANGSNKDRILVSPLSGVDDWGPAHRILFTTAGGRIARIKPDGTEKQLFTGREKWNHSPSYSPDGTRFAFQRCSRSDCRFWMMRPHRSKRRISGTTRPSDGPTWSPDGASVLVPFFRRSMKQWDLRLLTMRGSSLWLTNDGGIREVGAWQSR